MISKLFQHVQNMEKSVLTGPGSTDVKLRTKVFQFIEKLTLENKADFDSLPVELAPYIEKIGRHSYKITDEDIASLKNAGHSEEAILELSIAAALSAGSLRLRAGYRALGTGDAL